MTQETLIPAPPMGKADVIYVAVAEARGHLMRASQVCRMLHGEGLRVAPMVTGRRGLEFFRNASGMDADLLSNGYYHAYGPDHSLDVTGSTLNILSYTASPDGARDFAAISRRMLGARVMLNDLSTSPCAAALAFMVGGPHLINVLSENTMYALINVDKLCSNKAAGLVSKRILDSMFYAATINFVNTMDADKWFQEDGVLYFLPPYVQTTETARDTRCRWEGPTRQARRLFVAYFNPEFKQKAFIGHLVEAAKKADAFLYLVSEYAADWHQDLASDTVQIARDDFGLPTIFPKADLVITAAGLALPLQCYVAGTPLLVVVNRNHIEHARNADTMARHRMANIVDDFAEVPDAALRAMENGQEAHLWLPGKIRDAWRDRVIGMVDLPSLTMRGTRPVISAFRTPLEMD